MNDVNTIFYFYPNSKTEYEADWNANKINPRTIVFIASTGEIYKGGIRYGGLTLSEVRTETTTIVNENKFDPSSILSSISNLLGLINGLNSRISSIMTEKQEELTNIIGDVLSEYVTLKKTHRGLFQEQGFTDALDEYLLKIGNVTANSAIWSSYDLRINSITTSITRVEEVLGRLTENIIKQWIDNGIAGIDLSTFLTSADIEGLIKLDDLKASGVLDNLLTNFSTAFINLKSKAEGSEAIIGAWDRSTMGGTIKDLFSALSILVNNIESSVTTSLSSTVNSYLQDSALPNYISGYLSTQAGLVLEANLDHSVAALFSQLQYTEAKNAANSYLNTAGFLTETNADGALASIIATRTVSPENQKLYYCDSIDTSETAATFNAASGLSIAVGSYYSATELATICSSTTVIITGTATPFLILGTDSKKYKITKVSAMEGALASSSLYAAIQVGVKNDSSFIDMVADEVNIESKLLNITGETWANILHVNELVVNSLKDADGNSIQVSYLVDKMQENSTYTIEVLNLIPGITSLSSIGIRYYCDTEFALGEANTGTVLIAGHSAHFKLESPASISLVGHIKITMGGRDITSKYTTYGLDYDGYPVNVIDVNIPCVTGNVVVTISGKSDIGHREYGLPRIVNINGKSSDITLTADVFSNVTYVHTSGNNTYHYVDEVTDWNVIDPSDSQAKKSYGGIIISNGTASASTGVSSTTNVYKTPTITITPGSVSANDVITIAGTWISGTTTGDAIFSITIVDNASFPDYYYVDFDVTNNGALSILPDFSKAFITREDNITSQEYGLVEKTNSSIANITFSIDASYNDYAAITTVSSILHLWAKRHAMVPITMNVTLTDLVNGVDYIAEVTRWVCIKPKLFSSSNTTADVYLDIYGNSDRDLQFVSNDHTVGGVPIFTKYISYDRNSNTDYNYVYLCEEATDNPSITLDQTTGNEPPSWISTSDISLIVYNGKRYLVFKASNNSDALTHYNGLSHRITIEDQQVGRAGYINLNAADGSTCKIYVMQSGNLGFYDVLKDTVHNCVSPYYLTPKYHWKRIMWEYNASSDSIIKTDLYPNAILIPSAGWKAVVSSATSGAFGSNNNTEATMEYNPSNTNFDASAIFDL